MRDGRLFRRVQRNCWDPLVRIQDMNATGIVAEFYCRLGRLRA